MRATIAFQSVYKTFFQRITFYMTTTFTPDIDIQVANALFDFSSKGPAAIEVDT